MKTLSLRLRLLLSFGVLWVVTFGGAIWLVIFDVEKPVVWLMTLGASGLLIAGSAVLWCLAPLKRAGREIIALRQGACRQLAPDYPQELLPLTADLNAFIALSDDRSKRYRKRLDDLAHSFKTPLAIQRTAVESESDTAELRRIVLAQIERMDQSVKYHLKRAATQGQLSISRDVHIRSVAQRLIKAFNLKYADKALTFDIAIDSQLRFPGPEGDLLEILGNLWDNAGKAARRRIKLSALENKQHLILQVEDDGPGIPPAERNRVLQRGRRGEGYGEGSGIGLALINDIAAEGYQGWVEIDASALGGACVRVVLMKQ